MSDEISTETTAVENTEDGVSNATLEGDIPDAAPQGSDLKSDPDAPETFSRDYVEKLRQENGKYRQRAGEADALATRLHTELVRATGRLADPTDLPFDPDHIADAGNMVAAIDALLEAKPHLASRRPVGDIGQGQRGAGVEKFSLLQALKERT